MYQQECDDVLWDYWTKGQAINKRLTITPEQQHALHEIVDRRAGKTAANGHLCGYDITDILA